MRPFYTRMDVFVLLSRSGGLPAALNETMAAEVTVAATDGKRPTGDLVGA